MANQKTIMEVTLVMKRNITLAALLFTLVPMTAFGQAPNPNEVHIKNVTAIGNGCPSGTVGTMVSPDAKAFTMFFDQFIASGGGGTPIQEQQKVCNIGLQLHFPQGWSYSIVGVDYRGYAALDPGVRALQASEYWIQGAGTSRARLSSTFFGPYSDEYLLQDRLAVSAVIWSPCGAARNLNVRARVAVQGTSQTKRGLMTIDSIDGEVKHIYGVQWRRCRR
jgi:hypothetical protein